MMKNMWKNVQVDKKKWRYEQYIQRGDLIKKKKENATDGSNIYNCLIVRDRCRNIINLKAKGRKYRWGGQCQRRGKRVNTKNNKEKHKSIALENVKSKNKKDKVNKEKKT